MAATLPFAGRDIGVTRDRNNPSAQRVHLIDESIRPFAVPQVDVQRSIAAASCLVRMARSNKNKKRQLGSGHFSS
jgi:hypothetical protein